MTSERLPATTAPLSQPNWLAELESRLDPKWRPQEWDPRTSVFTGDPDNPRTTTFWCRVRACRNVLDAERTMCSPCLRAYDKSRGTSVELFVKSHVPRHRINAAPGESLPDRESLPFYMRGAWGHIRRNQFALAEVNPVVRAEILFGLEQRELNGFMVAPYVVRRLTVKLPPDLDSLLNLPDGFDTTIAAVLRGLLRGITAHLKALHARLFNIDLMAEDVWECAVVGLTSAPNRRYKAAFGRIDFRAIQQPWLRELIKEYGRAVRPPASELQRVVTSAAMASIVLSARANGDDCTKLGMDDMSAIAQAFATALHPAGRPYSHSHRLALLGHWRRTLDFCRQAGLMDQIPGSFTFNPRYHAMPLQELRGDEIGRAIPEHVITQLDDHLPLLRERSTFAQLGWSSDDFAEMYAVIYKLLRDTGRRPNEIVSLRRTCLEWIEDRPTLIWDNHKRRRMARRLPIHAETAATITQWLEHLEPLPVHPDAQEWLFPAPGARKRPRASHISTSQVTSKVWRDWLNIIPAIYDTGLDAQGQRRTVDKATLAPYGLRHAYAQRHADNGVDMEILSELMDHQSIETTRGYYTVSLDRKRRAIDQVTAYTVDRHGQPSAPTDPLTYERESVTVPFGNCLEPSNVKAGGRHCPIRYQCAGCSHYRPDPSYLPAIEDHITSLVADRETALAADTAPWVIDNLRQEAQAYRHVATTMRDTLSQLSTTEQEAVAEAGMLLRRDRSSGRTLLPLTVLTRDHP